MTDTIDKLIIQSETQGVQQTTEQLNQLGKSLDGVTVATQNVDKSTGPIDNRFVALERRFSTAAGQATQFEKVQRTVNTAVAQNPELQDRANAVLAAAETRYIGAGKAVEELATAHKGLDAQGQAAFHSIRSVVEQTALGIPFTQSLTGQINHLAFAASGEGGLAGAFSQVKNFAVGAVAAMVTPLSAVVAGTVAAGAAVVYFGLQWDNAQKQADRALLGIGQRTGTTAADIHQFAAANSSATGLSIKEARTAAEEFTKTGAITVSALHGVGEAIHGYSILTGQDAAQATKALASAFSGDLAAGAKKLDETYGVLDSGALEYIRTLELQGDRAKAQQFIIDALAASNQKAEGTVSALTQAYTLLGNAWDRVKNGPTPSSQSQSSQEQISSLQKRQETAPHDGQANYGMIETFEDIGKKIAAVQKAADSFNGGHITAQLTAMSRAGDDVVNSIIPQIAAIQKLEAEEKKLQDAQNTPGVSRGLGGDHDTAALTAIQNQKAALRASEDEAARYNERVKEISGSWGKVSQSTALSLEAAKNQLPVLQAVGGGAKMAAQYGADYANAIDQGKTSTEAAALAGSNMAASEAQVNSAALSTLASLQDQYAVAAAMNPIEAARAQGAATYAALVREGVDAEIARAVASQQTANAEERIWVANQKAVIASEQQLELIKATGTAQEGLTKASIAYDNAMMNGATAAQAGAIWYNELQGSAIQTARASAQTAQSLEAAADAAERLKATEFSPTVMTAGVQGGISTDPMAASPQISYKGSAHGAGMRIGGNGVAAFASSQPAATSSMEEILNRDAEIAYAVGGIDGAIGTVLKRTQTLQNENYTSGLNKLGSLYDFKNSQASSNQDKAYNLTQEVGMLQNLPQTMERDQKIADLRNSIDQLKNSTDGLNSTNQDLLSPYYTQDPRTSHIGFRSQGMAAGGYVDVPGSPSANDNMIATIPVASGERIFVDTMSTKRGLSAGGGSSQPVYINMPITVQGGANKNEIGRTMMQAGQRLAKQLQAAQAAS